MFEKYVQEGKKMLPHKQHVLRLFNFFTDEMKENSSSYRMEGWEEEGREVGRWRGDRQESKRETKKLCFPFVCFILVFNPHKTSMV